MKLYLPKIISEYQTGFMEGRHIGINIHKTIEVIEYAEKNNAGVIMSIDFEKCFDMIKNNAIIGSLRYFNFGENYI